MIDTLDSLIFVFYLPLAAAVLAKVYEAGTAAGLVQSWVEQGEGDSSSSSFSLSSSPSSSSSLVASEAVLVTVDGTDDCKVYHPEQDRGCGISTRGLANLMLQVFKVTSALSMDQVKTLTVCPRN
jgi:hypothetical protein